MAKNIISLETVIVWSPAKVQTSETDQSERRLRCAAAPLGSSVSSKISGWSWLFIQAFRAWQIATCIVVLFFRQNIRNSCRHWSLTRAEIVDVREGAGFLLFSPKSFLAYLVSQYTEKAEILFICQLFRLLEIIVCNIFIIVCANTNLIFTNTTFVCWNRERTYRVAISLPQQCLAFAT